MVDLIAYDDSSIIDALYLDEHGPRGGRCPPTELRRYTIDLDGRRRAARGARRGDASSCRASTTARRNTRDYRYAYFAGAASGGWIDQLVKVDVSDGTRTVWSGAGLLPRRAGLRARAGRARTRTPASCCRSCSTPPPARSFLLVLDAGSFEELARAEAPHHIPFGFHGQYFR